MASAKENDIPFKVLITVEGMMVAPRFDLTTEVAIIPQVSTSSDRSPRFILLPGPSADDLCELILKEGITCLICGGIADEHYQFLGWKHVEVIDRVIADWQVALELLLQERLASGTVIRKTTNRTATK